MVGMRAQVPRREVVRDHRRLTMSRRHRNDQAVQLTLRHFKELVIQDLDVPRRVMLTTRDNRHRLAG